MLIVNVSCLVKINKVQKVNQFHKTIKTCVSFVRWQSQVCHYNVNSVTVK